MELVDGGPDPRTRVFGWIGGNDGTAYWRLAMPLIALEQARPLEFSTSYATRCMPPTWQPREIDVLVGQRIADPVASEAWRTWCDMPDVLTVFEIDDNLFKIEEDNPAASVWANPEYLRRLKENIAAADVVTTSTPDLAAVVSRFNRNVRVLPNCVPSVLLQGERQEVADGKIVVGWQGSPTHRQDWHQVHDALGRILVEYPNVTLKVFGVDYTKGLPQGQVQFVPWTRNMAEHFTRLGALDIGLAPVRRTAFNRSKSHLKALEYMALGVPVIATAYAPYDRLIDNGRNGLLVSGGRSWYHAIKLLVEDEQLRRDLSAAGRRTAGKYTIESNIDKWADVYNGQ